jgi:hypothetical protein
MLMCYCHGSWQLWLQLVLEELLPLLKREQQQQQQQQEEKEEEEEEGNQLWLRSCLFWGYVRGYSTLE